LICSACGTENEPGRKFCGECGTPLVRVCATCGASNPPTVKFCGECGSRLSPESAPAGSTPVPLAGTGLAPTAERRLVSILFADLVGFTSLSEQRDAEEVRELLTRYFDTSRRIIERYGGNVEKFIGDAVMAVWGTPTAQEDDAERSVRAALELTQAISQLGAEVGALDLQARAGVLTGEAAVTLGAEGQGMVAGDLVNTASRIQSAAEPGTVLVGEVTKRATEAAIVYEDAGAHALKGKADRVQLWRAVRVVAGIGGAYKSTGLEPPFVGRDRDLRLVKELFHGAAEEKKAHLVSVIGIAGIGKSRLSWEFFKYLEGLAGLVLWHRGRCLSYGEGVTYWALADMVKMRCRISEGEDPASAITKLRTTLEQYVLDPEERKWIEPRLSHLLGLEERAARDPEELFSAWRLFIERMAEQTPVVMVFEDLQWADAALLDFIEYLLEWSRDFPVFVLTLARPDLIEQHQTWGAGKRNFTSLFLEPLSPGAMEALLSGLVPGLPEDVKQQILGRAEGVPLYAVETVRMLLDRGALVQEGNGYRLAETVGDLEVPETLHALIAARLDGLTPQERRLLQQAAVLGKVFTKAGVAAVAGEPEEEVEPLLASLIRKEVLSIQADPRSPEHGQYGFLQDLVKRVAYETLSKKDRKLRHLAAARFLESTWRVDEEEIVEVVASHYVDAYQAAPDAEDAADIKARALDLLAKAAERAASLAAREDAERYFERAADLADDPIRRAELFERAGEMAWHGGHQDEASGRFAEAIRLFEEAGQAHASARVSSRLAEVEWRTGHLDDAVARMERSMGVLSTAEPDEDLAILASQLGRFYFFKGDTALAEERNEVGLGIAESLWLPEVLSQALQTKALVRYSRERYEEGLALMKRALEIALENDLPWATIRGYINTADSFNLRDRYEDALKLYEDAIALSRKLGYRTWESVLLSETTYPLLQLGRWDEIREVASTLEDYRVGRGVMAIVSVVPQLLVRRGEVAEAEQAIERFSGFADSADLQERVLFASALASVRNAQGEHAEALRLARSVLDARGQLGVGTQPIKDAFVEAIEASLALGDLSTAEAILDEIGSLPRGELPPSLRAQTTRFRARLLVQRGEDGAEAAFKAATGMFRELQLPLWLAMVVFEHAEWLAQGGRAGEAEPLLREAGEIFRRLEANPWIERVTTAESHIERETPSMAGTSG
jgi:class 3 adenylate cyclase/tetratricopeptide (TPR) repeat protein